MLHLSTLALRQSLPNQMNGPCCTLHHGEFGIDLHGVASLSAICSVLSSICSGCYGFLTAVLLQLCSRFLASRMRSGR